MTDQPAPAQPAGDPPVKRVASGRNGSGRPPLTDAATLLNAALEIGYPRLTVGAVTSAVGVKYSTFYRHFPSLDHLTAACLDHHLERLAWPTIEPRDHWHPHLIKLGHELAGLVDHRPGLADALCHLANVEHAAADPATKRPAPPRRIPLRLQTAAEDAVEILNRAGLHAADCWDTAWHVIGSATNPTPTVLTRRRAHVDNAAQGVAYRLGVRIPS